VKSRLSFVLALVLLTSTIPALAKENGALRLVPADSVTVGMVQLSELRNSPLASRVFTHWDNMTLDGDSDLFLRDAGFNPARDVDTIVCALTQDQDANGGNPLLIVEGRFDVNRISGALSEKGAVQVTAAGGSYFRFDDTQDEAKGAVAFLSSNLAVAGKEAAVRNAIETNARGGTDFVQAGGLAHLLGTVDSNSSAWLLVDVPRAQRLKRETHLPGDSGRNEAMERALHDVAAIAVWADDRGDEMSVGATATANDAETLQLLEDLVRGMLATWRLAAQDKAPELVSEIRRFNVVRNASSVTLRGSISSETIEKLQKRAGHARLGK
jgi:hypothetical protein